MIGNTNATQEIKFLKFVDYIESTGAQYIDTGVVPTVQTKIELDLLMSGTFKNTGTYGGNGGFFGAIDSASAFSVNFGGDANQYNELFVWNDKTSSGGGTVKSLKELDNIITTRNTFALDNNNASWGSVSTELNTKTTTHTNSLVIFGRKIDGTSSPFTAYNMRLFFCKIWDNDVLVRDFKPCVDKYGIYCLYDLVERKFYYSKGTENFRGDGWQPKRLEYIEATGTQYIKTGIIPSVNTTYEISVDITVPDVKTDACLFGSRTSGSSNQFILWDNHNTDDIKHLTVPTFNTYNAANTIYTKSTSNVFRYDGTTFYINDEVGLVVKNNMSNATYQLYLFALNQNDVADSRMYLGKLYYFKIHQNGTLVRDYIPAKDDKGVACLYDNVSKTFFYNAGTGSFIAG